jgi:hypothetical protein
MKALIVIAILISSMVFFSPAVSRADDSVWHLEAITCDVCLRDTEGFGKYPTRAECETAQTALLMGKITTECVDDTAWPRDSRRLTLEAACTAEEREYDANHRELLGMPPGDCVQAWPGYPTRAAGWLAAVAQAKEAAKVPLWVIVSPRRDGYLFSDKSECEKVAGLVPNSRAVFLCALLIDE